MLFKPLLPLVEYAVNYEYISKVLCENKEKPIMGCNGKCYLMKQLAATSESEKPRTDKKIIVKSMEILFLEPIPAVDFKTVFIERKSTVNAGNINLYSYLSLGYCFRPPSFIA